MDGPMHQKGSPCGSQKALSTGLLWITNFLPGGASGVWLYWNDPYKYAYTDRLGCSLDCIIRFRIIVDCWSILSHSLMWKSG